MSERLNTMKAVYCYFFPEVRPLVERVEKTLSTPDGQSIFLTQTPVEKARDALKPLGLKPDLEIPSTESGNVDLDEIHEPIIDRVISAYKNAVPGLKDFSFRYPTSGSSEGIYHLMAELKKSGLSEIYTPQGEYEGFEEYGKELGLKKVEVDLENTDPRSLRPGVWFISNPSARQGNIIPNETIIKLCEAGHKVIPDLAYVGSTKDYQFDVDHPNIPAVVMSWSKPYGLFRFRIGITFSKKPIDSLYANKWFKDIGRLLLGLVVAEEIGPHKMHPKYEGVHKKIIDQINKETALRMRKSDALLLGYLTEEDVRPLDKDLLASIEKYKRGKVYRFCLEPYYEEIEKKKIKEFHTHPRK